MEASLAFSLWFLLLSLFFTFFAAQTIRLRLQRELDRITEQVSLWSYSLSFIERYTGSDLLSMIDGSQLAEVLSGDQAALLPLLEDPQSGLREVKRFLLDRGSAALWQPLLLHFLKESVGEELLNSGWIRAGAGGLSLSGSTLRNSELDLLLSYRIESPLRFPLPLSFSVKQRSCRRLWVGTGGLPAPEKNESEETVVFVTQQGEVYHLSRDCRILKLKVRTVGLGDIDHYRNTAQGRYYPCEDCAARKLSPETPVQITESGIRYHADPNCSHLKRSIRELSLEEAKKTYRPCYYCGKESSG